MLLLKLRDALIDLLQSHRVGIPHRTTAIGGETIAVEIDDVDVNRPQRVSFFENSRALIYQRIDAAIDDLDSRDLPLRDSCVRAPLAYESGHFGISARTAVLVVLVPSLPGFLAIAAEFTETIFGEWLPDSGFFEMTILLANAPADVETGKIAGCQRPHGITEIDQRLVYGFDVCAFFHQKLRLPPVGAKHAVAYEAATVSYQHPDFPQPLRELHASGDHFFA